jgi:hypothetical protein
VRNNSGESPSCIEFIDSADAPGGHQPKRLTIDHSLCADGCLLGERTAGLMHPFSPKADNIAVPRYDLIILGFLLAQKKGEGAV